MSNHVKLAIYEPGNEGKKGRYFTLRLKTFVGKERSVFRPPSKALVIPSIAGDFQDFLETLLKFQVIDRKHQWIYEDGHIILNGNYLSKQTKKAECLWYIYGLEERAFRRGGHVHFILGMDELMLLNEKKWIDQHPDYAFSRKRSSGQSYSILYDGNNELLRWLRTKNIVEKIGSSLFLNKEIAAEILMSGLPITEINKSSFEDRYKGLAFSLDLCSIQNIVEKYDVQTIVTGNYHIAETVSYSNGTIIDVPASKKEALLIQNESFYRVFSDKEKVELTL
ncbi:hypothetical protein [Chitinophaga sp. XS-30]|uniref:hypothetical protein n=1 Tax=Chitinophaga sp. XS-30 TaxID=2604421 RepID=UPI0011DC926B|nr:hypothetical protein [Chitinophaga sp. XS-30]QEH42202.1 hypothetical protein FW415_15500 [Chitinophaga sp. XS-30]